MGGMKSHYLSGAGMLVKGVSFLYPPLALLGWALWLLGVRRYPRAYLLSLYSGGLVLVGAWLTIVGIAKLDPEILLTEENIMFFLGGYLVAQAGGVVFSFALKALELRLGTVWLVAVLLFPLGLPVLYGLRLWLAYLFLRGLPLEKEPAHGDAGQGVEEVRVGTPR